MFKIPDRSVLIAFVAGFIVNFVASIAQSKFGFAISAELQGGAMVALTALLVHLVPDSVQNLIDKLNDSIVIKAMRDPNSNVSTLPDLVKKTGGS
jgi:hypothetical protein